MSSALEVLRQQIFQVKELEPAAWEDLAASWSELKVKRKQLLTRAGETERYLYLVLEGVQRAYFLHDNKEATLVFSYAPSFSGVIDSFFTQKPSLFYLETLTNSRLLRIHHHDLTVLIDKHRCIESWVRVALTQTLGGTLQRQVELLSYNAEEKFTTLLRRSPLVLQLIPHKYLASYIGVDPATFSKLLATVRL